MPTRRPDLPAAQQRNFRALAKSQERLDAVSEKLDAALNQRHTIVLKIFDELERHPEGYSQVVYRGKRKEEHALTPTMVRRMRNKYERQVLKRQGRLNTRGGPGCSECEDREGCFCVFRLGPLCCYICASPAVIQCSF